MSAAVSRVGFVGLGTIGKPMALRLARSDVDLSVHDVAREPVAELVGAGARSSASVAELAQGCDLLCVMVRDDVQVRQVVAEALDAASAGLVLALHSTVSPHTPAELAGSAAAHGIRIIDAPVSGGAAGAADGELAIMVGADAATFTLVHPVLSVLGSMVVHAGPVGAGTRFKLARNMLTFTGFAAVGEALRLAEASGLDLRALGEVVRHTDALNGGPGAIMHRDTTRTLPPDDFWHAIFTDLASLGEKDLGFTVELADELGVDVPLARLALTNLASGFGLPRSQ